MIELVCLNNFLDEGVADDIGLFEEEEFDFVDVFEDVDGLF